ncbi:hypothetical protein [Bosea lathyri]|uniref:Uncharacterized protein n=1 Tax=Bosea lathyri TaxID=1036778 RepID=A0A1H5XCT5_9HYPH|nr:hypothetical protein [Bosea lathyri]SEG09240.1 hypothetical protein SAMN04488115_103180 [Bosea lathyri]
MVNTLEQAMTGEQFPSDRTEREALLRRLAHEAESRAGAVAVAEQEDGEDWPVLSCLFGGLAAALLMNTFVSLF